MKKNYNEFLKILSNIFLIICFAIASYLILINYFHYDEISEPYIYNVSQKSEYEKFKKRVLNVEKKLNNEKIKLDNQKYASYFSSIKDQLNRCIIKIKTSNYYNVKSNSISLVDIYNYNEDMYKTLQGECLYVPNLKIVEGNTKNNLTINYNLEENVLNSRKDIIYISAYLSDKMSANNSYYYTTDSTKSTIFNDIKYSMDLTINNYSTLSKNLEEITNWYLEQINKVGDNK